MAENPNIAHVTTVLNNCSTQLRVAHTRLGKSNAPLDALAKILGVADALEALTPQVTAVLQDAEQARRTAGGLVSAQRFRRPRAIVEESDET